MDTVVASVARAPYGMNVRCCARARLADDGICPICRARSRMSASPQWFPVSTAGRSDRNHTRRRLDANEDADVSEADLRAPECRTAFVSASRPMHQLLLDPQGIATRRARRRICTDRVIRGQVAHACRSAAVRSRVWSVGERDPRWTDASPILLDFVSTRLCSSPTRRCFQLPRNDVELQCHADQVPAAYRGSRGLRAFPAQRPKPNSGHPRWPYST
jgi:hypothetical protein